MRRALGSGSPRAGCRAGRRRSSGSTRMTVPSSVTGSPACAGPGCAARRLRPSAGSASRPTPPGGSPQGLTRVAVLAVVDEVEARAVAAAHVEGAVGAELERADRVARVLLAPVLDQDLLGAGHHVAGAPAGATGGRSRRSRRWSRPGGFGHRRSRAGRTPARRGAADRRVVRVEDVDVGVREVGIGKFGSSAMPEQARGPRSCGPSSPGRRRRSASCPTRLSKTLIRPLFSATNTRPSGAKRTTVGLVRPLKAVVS